MEELFKKRVRVEALLRAVGNVSGASLLRLSVVCLSWKMRAVVTSCLGGCRCEINTGYFANKRGNI